MTSKLVQAIWRQLVIGNHPISTNDEGAGQISIIRTFSLIGVFTLSLFSVMNLGKHGIVTGVFELIIAIILLINRWILQRTLNFKLAGNIFLLSAISILVILLITGGLGRTGIYWMLVFPVIAYFVKGRDEGTLWILGHLAVVVVCQLLFKTNYIYLSFSELEIRQIIACTIVMSALIYSYYQFVHGQDSKVLVRRERLLNHKIDELRLKIVRLEQARQQQNALVNTIDKTITKVQTSNFDLEQTKLAMLNVLEDLEFERRRIEENERKDEAILASIGEGMVATDATGKIIIVNRQAEELLGYTSKELIGEDYFRKIVPVTADGDVVALKYRPLSQALKTGKPVGSSSYQYQRKDKSAFPVSITSSPIQIEGKQTGGIVVFRDITKEKQIDKAKTEFVSLASHQLRTPLSAIGWYVEMLLSGDAGKLAKEQVDYLKEIQHGSKRLVDMVNSLLNVSRIELGTFMVEPKPTKPVEIAEAVLGEVKSLIEKKQLKLVKKFDKDIPVMKLDPHLLEIVLQNLVSNAVKYTPDTGSITISLSYATDALTITVADTGIGIPKDQLGRIFEKLFRADNVRATDTDGTGLGLYMVKQILEEIGGKVELRSVLNKGTTVTVRLPSAGMMPRKGTRRLA